jgi:hypothetical protein
MRKLAWSSFVLGAVALLGGARCGRDEGAGSSGGEGGEGGAATSEENGGASGASSPGGSGNDAGGTGEGGAGAGASGGSAGNGPDPFADAPEAEWEPFGTFGTCEVDRLVEPERHTLFYWKPCEGIEGCEIAVMNTKVAEVSGLLNYPGPNSSVTGDGDAFFGLTFPGVQSYTLFVENDGKLIDGFLNVQIVGEDPCLFGGAPVSGTSYAFVIARSTEAPVIPLGGVIFARDTQQQRGDLAIDDTVTGPPGDWVFGADRLGTTYVFPTRQASLSVLDGSDFRLFATSTGVITDMSEMITTGPQFLFTALTTETPEKYIMASDGVEPPVPYIRAEDGSYTGEPSYAHSRIVWQKGISPESVNRFERVELWASEYDPDPEKLEPYKVADLDEPYMPFSIGGWDHYANHIFDVETNESTLRIWNVLTRTHRDYSVPEELRRMRRLIGMTPEHLYAVADHVEGLMRFEVE